MLGDGPRSVTDASVLVVEEDPYMANLLATVITDLAAKWVVTANSRGEAEDYLSKGRIDVVVLDWLKHTGRGLDLVRFIRTAAESPDQEIPVVLCTARRGYDDIVSARDVGVSEVLAKPFSHGEVEAKLKAALLRKRRFIRSEVYTGPDRRRKSRGPQGEERRNNQGLSQGEIDLLMKEFG